MKYYILGSGSGGNSTALVNDKNEILLIDCGLPIIEIKRRLSEVGLDFDNVKKVLITHMHVDKYGHLAFQIDQLIYLIIMRSSNF